MTIKTDLHGHKYHALFMDRQMGEQALLKQGFERRLGSKVLQNGDKYAFYNKFLNHWVIQGGEL